MKTLPSFACAMLLWATAATAYEAKEAEPEPTQRQYTFAWQFVDGDAMSPRGGTSKGTELTLVEQPSAAWQALQAPGLSSFERDRRAILAMAGEYRASFDFIEVAGFIGPYQPQRPYQSWGTEKVYVIEDSGERIVLQHLLVMRMVKDDGSVVGPFVTKHWRQDWIYEPAHTLAYRGLHRWDWVDVPEQQRRGSWTQIVYQVDDSPRYGGVGQWQHHGNYSSWEGGDGWRPLPRREWSVRSDYQVLVGSNRHTITPTGWVHEQQNNKLALADNGLPRATDPVVAREFGYNRYELITGTDFSVGDAYLAATEAFWAQIRAEWARRFQAQGRLQLRGAPDQDRLFLPAFEYAQALADSGSADDDLALKARRFVDDYLAKD
jgi:hypothetical protein